jgi:RNA polymerase sigma-70 factor, ECF subfamily
MSDERGHLTGLLHAWSEGDSEAMASVAALVNEELRAMARRMLAGESAQGQWRPTELVDEAYLRLLDWHGVQWQNRAHFFGTVAGMMRRILVDSARARNAGKRGDGAEALPLDKIQVAAARTEPDLLAVEDALQKLEALNPRAGRVVEMRFFGGFSVEETAEALGISRRTVINDWNTARAWLRNQLAPAAAPPGTTR